MSLAEYARKPPRGPAGSMMRPNDRRWLLAAARHCLRACVAPYLLEIGAYMGASTALLALAAREAREDAVVISIDPFWSDICSSYTTPYFEDWLGSISKENVLPAVVGIVSTSERASALIPYRLNFCLIDGNHAYQAVLEDLQMYAGRVDSEGLVFLHDYQLVGSGVKQAASEYAADQSWQIWECPPGYPLADFAILYQSQEALEGMKGWLDRDPNGS